MLIGLMVHLISASTTTLLLLGFAMLIFFIACLGYLVHFLLRFGLKRTFAVILTGLMVTTLFFSIRQPAGTNLSARIVDGFGMTLTTPFFWASQIGQLAYESGREFGQRYFKQDEMVDIGEPQDENIFERDMRTLFPPTGEPATGEPTITEPTPAPTAQPEILRPAGDIKIGGRVKIETDGSRLRGAMRLVWAGQWSPCSSRVSSYRFSKDRLMRTDIPGGKSKAEIRWGGVHRIS
jgi:hypothetical protein